MKTTMRARPSHRALALACVSALWALGAGCENSVEPDLTPGELIRLLVETGGDESILFSPAILADQTGTDAFSRTIESASRRFDSTLGFFDDTLDFPSSRPAWEGFVRDVLSGTLTFQVGSTTVTRAYASLLFDGKARFTETQLGSENPWQIWRMQYRHAEQPTGDGSPMIVAMTLSHNGVSHVVTNSDLKRIFRDSVMTIPHGVLSDLTITVTCNTKDDSLFVTYPVMAGVYETVAMRHTSSDSLRHSATVQVRSTRRYELLAVQAFKRRAFTDSTYVQASASAVRSAILRFYSP
jgi:hypothetical protein